MNFGKDPHILLNLGTCVRGVTRTYQRCRPLLTSLREYPPVDAHPTSCARNGRFRSRQAPARSGGRPGRRPGAEQPHDLARSPPTRRASGVTAALGDGAPRGPRGPARQPLRRYLLGDRAGARARGDRFGTRDPEGTARRWGTPAGARRRSGDDDTTTPQAGRRHRAPVSGHRARPPSSERRAPGTGRWARAAQLRAPSTASQLRAPSTASQLRAPSTGHGVPAPSTGHLPRAPGA